MFFKSHNFWWKTIAIGVPSLFVLAVLLLSEII